MPRRKNIAIRKKIESRLTLAAFLFVPIVFYIIGILYLPKRYPAFISDVEIAAQIKPIINLLTPLLLAIVVFYFYDPPKSRRQRRLTSAQFWVAAFFVIAYDLIVGVAFWVIVWAADYSSPDTYQESLSGRINTFASVMNSCALIIMVPVARVFLKNIDDRDAFNRSTTSSLG